MTDDPYDSPRSLGLLETLLSPLRAPERVVRDIEQIAASLLSVEGVIQQHLTSVDGRAGGLLGAVGTLQDTLETLRSPMNRIDRKVTQLTKLEQVIKASIEELQNPLDRIDRKMTELGKLEQSVTERMDAINRDLNERMLAVEQEVRTMRAPIQQMAGDLSKVQGLLPEPTDGPLTRLKDTFTTN